MRAKVGEVYLDTKENKLFEIRARRWGEYKISGYCTYFSDTRMSLPACESFIDECYLSRYCERVELYSNLLIRNHIGVRVRLKEDDIKTVVRSPFSHPAEIGEVYYDEYQNTLFQFRGVKDGNVLGGWFCECYGNVENGGNVPYTSIERFNKDCVRAYPGSNFLRKYDDTIRTPELPTKTEVCRAHIAVEPVQPICRYGIQIKRVLDDLTDKQLIVEFDNLSDKDVIRLAQKIHGRMYRIIRGKK